MKAAVFHNLPLGGALRALQEQISRLSGKHEIHCYSLSSSAENGLALDSCGVKSKVYKYWLGSPSSMSLFDWVKAFQRMISVQRQIAEQINQGDYDVCLTNTCPYFEIPSLHRFLQIPVVYYAHSIPNPTVSASRSTEVKKKRNLNPLGPLFQRAMRNEKQRSITCASSVVCNSRFLKGELHKLYKVQATVNRLGVNTDFFYPQPDAAKGNYVLGVGTLAPFKAHDFSIISISHIPKQQRPELWIAYPAESPGERDYLTWLAAERGVHLELFAEVNAAYMRKLYSSALATIYPSSYEALGLVPLESMACGTPVIGVAEGGIPETIVDGVTGYLTKRDPEEFAGRVMEVLSSPEPASEMGAKGRKYVKANWNWVRSVEHLELALADAACCGAYLAYQID